MAKKTVTVGTTTTYPDGRVIKRREVLPAARTGTGRLSFWQSMQFFTLTRKGGKLAEKPAGKKRPEGATFIKGGRKSAMLEAQRLWPGVQVETLKPTMAAVQDDELVRGDMEPTPKPLEPEESPEIMAKPPKLTKSRGLFSKSPFVRISPRTPRLS